MTELNPATTRVIDAALSTEGHVDIANPEKGINKLRLSAAAAALRAAVEQSIQPDPIMGIDCIIYARDLLRIATELEDAS